MQETLDQDLIAVQPTLVRYGGFLPRVGAVLFDTITVGGAVAAMSYYNIIAWKSPAFLIVLTVLSVAYKPFMEHLYGATWGKMVLGLKVTTPEQMQPGFDRILLRNIFHSAFRLFRWCSLSVSTSPPRFRRYPPGENTVRW